MYEIKVKEHLSKTPVFSLSDINKIISNKEYSKRFLKRMYERKEIFKIKKNLYTFHSNPFLVSTFVVKPSYISSFSALHYYKLITQIPKEVICMTPKKHSEITFNEKIRFVNTNNFFGFREIEYENTKIPIAEPEKAIIDSLNIIPISVFEEAFDSINEEKMIEYIERTKKSSIIKRIGYLLEKQGYDEYKRLKRYINYRYIPLDPLLRKKHVKNKKWGLLV